MIYAAYVYPGRVGFENELNAFLHAEIEIISINLPFTPQELLGTRIVFAGNEKRYIKTAQTIINGNRLALFVREAADDETERQDAREREADIVFLTGNRVLNTVKLPSRKAMTIIQ